MEEVFLVEVLDDCYRDVYDVVGIYNAKEGAMFHYNLLCTDNNKRLALREEVEIKEIRVTSCKVNHQPLEKVVLVDWVNPLILMDTYFDGEMEEWHDNTWDELLEDLADDNSN